jgi:CTP synthase (UTP-ammonia lyase)
MVRIGVVGDYNPANPTHVSTTTGVAEAAAAIGAEAEVTWIPTEEIGASDDLPTLLDFDALFISPGSPYRSLDGAVAAIEHARRRSVPLLGTCGGFQHLVLEFARNVAGFADASHAEYDPDAPSLFITPLSCSLRGQTMTIRLRENTIAAAAYGRATATERYYCDFGLGPDHVATIVEAGLTVSGTDADGEPRILELPSHPFFMGTLFVPQASSTPAEPHPLLIAFVTAACAQAGASTGRPSAAAESHSRLS